MQSFRCYNLIEVFPYPFIQGKLKMRYFRWYLELKVIARSTNLSWWILWPFNVQQPKEILQYEGWVCSLAPRTAPRTIYLRANCCNSYLESPAISGHCSPRSQDSSSNCLWLTSGNWEFLFKVCKKLAMWLLSKFPLIWANLGLNQTQVK